jgi:voltage-gated potassium channel
MSLRDRVAAAFDSTWSKSWRVVNSVIFIAIAGSVTATVLETVPSLDRSFGPTFDAIERLSAWLFTAELALRIWCAPSRAGQFGQRRHPRLAYIFGWAGIIDIVSVVPYYLGAANLMVLRSLRLIRVFRLLKLTRQARAMQLLGQAIRARKDELFSLIMIVSLALLLSATVMYSVEHEAQPQHFGSIPQSLWWSVATLTAVGYGDFYPVTVLGRICAAVIMIGCIGLVSLPTAILGSAMYEMATPKKCPRCGALPTDESGPTSTRTQPSAQPNYPESSAPSSRLGGPPA